MINRHLYLKEMKRNRKAGIVWTLLIMVLVMFILSLYPTVSGMMAQLTVLMQSFPVPMMRIIGFDFAAWGSVIGYYSTDYSLHVMILSNIYSVMLAGSIISKEEREGTAEFLITRPLTRWDVWSGKVAAYFSWMFIFIFFQALAALTGMRLFADEHIQWQRFFTVNLYGMLIIFLFGGLSLLLSLTSYRGRQVTALAIGILLGTYVVDALSRISPSTEWLGSISPFHYADFNAAAAGYKMELWRFCLLFFPAIGFFAASFLVFRKKDLTI
ncbi:MAG: ABC transporter permease subunit [Bacteroidia bacterium]